MLLSRVILGTLMIVALVGLVALDMWLSQDVPNVPAVTTYSGKGAISAAASCPSEQAAPSVAVACSGGRSGLGLSGLPIVLVAVALAGLAVYELGAILSVKDYRPVRHLAAFVTVGLVVMPWLELQQTWCLASTRAPLVGAGSMLTLLWLTGGMIGTALVVLVRRNTDRAIVAMAATVFMFAYVGLLGSFLVRIRCLYPGSAGAALLLYCVLTIKACDIGAYLAGRVFGRHLLAPRLSPKKTIEGFVGGLVLACLTAVGGIWLWTYSVPSLLGEHPLTTSQALIFGALMAIVGHLGDLAESAIKRDVGLKDSGRAVASFGGLLDVLDSPLFAAPIAWWLLTLSA